MSARRLGKAVFDLEAQLWGIPDKPEQFYMDPRLVDGHSAAKSFRSRHAKFLRMATPSRRQSIKRTEYFKIKELYDREWQDCLRQIINEIRESSEISPLPLRRHRDFDHNSDLRYCLFRGVIYQFDRPNYSVDQMSEMIEAFEKSRQPAAGEGA